MAKRTSKKASSPESTKEEPAIKKNTLGESKTAVAAKEKAVKVRSNSKKSAPTKSRKKTAVIDLADMEQTKPPPGKAPRRGVKAEREEVKKKPVSKVATLGKGKTDRWNRPAIKKASSMSAVKPALRSVYSNSKHTLMVLGFGSDFNTKKSVVIFSDLLTGQVHTIALSIWNRWKLREVKKINTET